MAFGDKNKGNTMTDSTDTAPVTDPSTDSAPATDTPAKPEVVIPAGHDKVVDFAAALTFKRVADAVAKGEAPSADNDYVSINEVYGWIQAGLPSAKYGEGKQGVRVVTSEAHAWLATYVPAKRGRQALAPDVKIQSDLARLLAKAKAAGVDVSATLATMSAPAAG